MKNYLIKLILFFVLIISSGSKAEMKISNGTQLIDSIQNILERQILSGYAIKEKGLDMISDYQYGVNDYEAVKKNSVDILKKNGYKNIDDKEFQRKITTIFGFTTPTQDINFLVEYPCKLEEKAYQLKEDYIISNNNPIFIDVRNKVLFESLFIPQLLDYKKQYPEVYKKELQIPKEKNLSGEMVKVIKWKDVKGIDDVRFNNIQKLVHRNKYLFNDSKASLSWLKFNDKIFLESLVKTFGYVKDEDLLNFVLKNNYKNEEELEKVLWNKRCNGEVFFNKEVMDVIAQADTDRKLNYLTAIQNYITHTIARKDSFIDQNFSKQAEILGKLAYYGEKISENSEVKLQFFNILGITDGGESYQKEFEKSNYYNISDFKRKWEETKAGGVSYPGME